MSLRFSWSIGLYQAWAHPSTLVGGGYVETEAMHRTINLKKHSSKIAYPIPQKYTNRPNNSAQIQIFLVFIYYHVAQYYFAQKKINPYTQISFQFRKFTTSVLSRPVLLFIYYSESNPQMSFMKEVWTCRMTYSSLSIVFFHSCKIQMHLNPQNPPSQFVFKIVNTNLQPLQEGQFICQLERGLFACMIQQPWMIRVHRKKVWQESTSEHLQWSKTNAKTSPHPKFPQQIYY